MMKLCDQVRETAYAIHLYHGKGYMEKVYENALAHRLRKQGLEVRQQHPLLVYDEDGTVIGEYYADLLIENALIVELKACKSIIGEHVAQLLNYLKGAAKEHGPLINFGTERFYIRKYVRSIRPEPRSRNLSALLFAFYAFFCGWKIR